VLRKTFLPFIILNLFLPLIIVDHQNVIKMMFIIKLMYDISP